MPQLNADLSIAECTAAVHGHSVKIVHEYSMNTLGFAGMERQG